MSWGEIRDLLVFYFAPVSLEAGEEFKQSIKNKRTL